MCELTQQLLGVSDGLSISAEAMEHILKTASDCVQGQDILASCKASSNEDVKANAKDLEASIEKVKSAADQHFYHPNYAEDMFRNMWMGSSILLAEKVDGESECEVHPLLMALAVEGLNMNGRLMRQ